MNASRPWLALVVALFCLPLFYGLKNRDLENDEAIYSFAVDRILETGDWLEPRASPIDSMAFLEKPPLKFWIVAAPIRLGLLPHDEFGLRFWDALFGSVAFVYVFLIGARLFNPITGFVAVLALFAHRPLLFDHGLRDNVMEGPLFLCYCGGVYHYLRWSWSHEPALMLGPPYARAEPGVETVVRGPGLQAGHAFASRRGRHVLAVGLYFVLGFMTKFVAALFLPFVLGVSALLLRRHRALLRRDWRLWTGSIAVVLVLTVPWFVYAQSRYGTYYWEAIFAEHVYRRFTSYLDSGHVQPLLYYFTTMYQQFLASGTMLLGVLGLVLLLVQTIRRGWTDGAVVLIWFALPLIVISTGTSKLYYYTYPFLPPVALAIGYLVAMLFALAPAPFDRALTRLYGTRPDGAGFVRRPLVRSLLLVLAGAAIAVGVTSLLIGTIRIPLRDDVVFRSSGIFRPAVVALTLILLGGLSRQARRLVLLLLIVALLPLPGYRASLEAMTVEEHPYRSVSACLRRIDSARADGPRGLYVAWPDMGIWHPVNYYFRRVRPVQRSFEVDPAALRESGADRTHVAPASYTSPSFSSGDARTNPGPSSGANVSDGLRPTVIWRHYYRALPPDLRTALPEPLDLRYDVLLLLPGPFAACRAEAGVLDVGR
jgi:4-amino-4-deoxy-L-arabinose transferase-like glycosyltransferase